MDYSNDNSMDIDVNHSSSRQNDPLVPIGNRYDVVISSVGLHVEGPISYINSPGPPSDQHGIIQIQSTNNVTELDRASIISSRERSPEVFHEENVNEINDDEVKTVSQTSGDDNSQNPSSSQIEDEDDGTLCPICLDNWTNTGDHRICSLKCGHLFGYKCVNRWLESQQKKSCPTCKKAVKRSDLRYIYAKKLIAVDTTELENMRQQLEEALTEKNKILQDVTRYVSREHILNQEIAQLKKQIRDLTGGTKSADFRLLQSSHTSMVRLYMDKTMEVCKQNGSRVFDANPHLDLIAVSMRSPANLWSGYGVRKINIGQYKQLIFIPLHDLQIRDVSFHPTNNWILTASMDKKSKVVDIAQNIVLYTTNQTAPLWSCCWDSNNDYVLYIGTQSGAVVKYDVRNMNVPVCSLEVNGDMSPVVSISCIPSGPNSDLVSGGVISCKLNSLWIFEKAGDGHIRHSLPLEGPFVSMKYQKDTRQMLVSSRPNNRISYARHTLCTLEKICDPDSISCHIVHSFQGGGMQKLLSKSCFLTDKQDYVAAHHESNKSVYLWSINTGERVCSVPAHEAVLDLKGVQSKSGNFLVSLTEKKLEFFKFNTF